MISSKIITSWTIFPVFSPFSPPPPLFQTLGGRGGGGGIYSQEIWMQTNTPSDCTSGPPVCVGTSPRPPGGAGHGGGEVEARILHVGAVCEPT